MALRDLLKLFKRKPKTSPASSNSTSKEEDHEFTVAELDTIGQGIDPKLQDINPRLYQDLVNKQNGVDPTELTEEEMDKIQQVHVGEEVMLPPNAYDEAKKELLEQQLGVLKEIQERQEKASYEEEQSEEYHR